MNIINNQSVNVNSKSDNSSAMEQMKVQKRDGTLEEVSFSKIQGRISHECKDLNVDVIDVARIVIGKLTDKIKTSEIDNITARTAISMYTKHPDYNTLSSRITVSNHHKQTLSTFSDKIKYLYAFKDKGGNNHPLIDRKVYKFVMKYSKQLDNMIDYSRDYNHDFFGLKTLERSYLLNIGKNIVERPQDMWLRVAVGIHHSYNGNNCPNNTSANAISISIEECLENIKKTYDSLSQKQYTHATPTLFNAGTPRPQFSSCFLIGTQDSIKGIYKTLSDCASIQKWAGGIGIHISNIRSEGSHIRGTNGHSNGIVPMLRVFDANAEYVDQGGGKRKGSIAVYIEPWHSDIMAFLKLRRNNGNEKERARSLFYALWVSDLFMERMSEGKDWSLFCPDECPGLDETHGEEHRNLYIRYEREGKARNVIPARKVWEEIVNSQIETGTPYICYKDAVNRKSNQKNLGTIKSSNLCAEINLYSDHKEYAVCTLASLCLPSFVKQQHLKNNELNIYFDHKALGKAVGELVVNLDRIIETAFYPTKETKKSNLRHRPLGIGVQGLADTFLKLKLPFESKEAQQLNRDIFETIYYYAANKSCELAVEQGFGSYDSFEGSPISKGILQHDLWGRKDKELSGRYDWNALRERVKKGVRNSTFIALMPTASTSQIMGNNEAFEAYTSNIYVRRTLAGEFICVNDHLIRDLIERGIWDDNMKNEIIRNKGSVQEIENIPNDVKKLYKTMWEIKQKTIINMAADRGAFVCQSQSMNLYLKKPTFNKLTSMHKYAWKKGLKTGIYYLRIPPAVEAQQVTVKPVKAKLRKTKHNGTGISNYSAIKLIQRSKIKPMRIESGDSISNSNSNSNGITSPPPDSEFSMPNSPTDSETKSIIINTDIDSQIDTLTLHSLEKCSSCDKVKPVFEELEKQGYPVTIKKWTRINKPTKFKTFPQFEWDNGILYKGGRTLQEFIDYINLGMPPNQDVKISKNNDIENIKKFAADNNKTCEMCSA